MILSGGPHDGKLVDPERFFDRATDGPVTVTISWYGTHHRYRQSDTEPGVAEYLGTVDRLEDAT